MNEPCRCVPLLHTIERLIPNSSLLRVRCEPVAVSRVSALGVMAVLVESPQLECFVGSVKKKKCDQR